MFAHQDSVSLPHPLPSHRLPTNAFFARLPPQPQTPP
jgi:hypothetical protein